MTTATLQLTAWPASDSAYGEEAQKLRRMFAKVTDELSATETYGQPLRALNAAFSDCRNG